MYETWCDTCLKKYDAKNNLEANKNDLEAIVTVADSRDDAKNDFEANKNDFEDFEANKNDLEANKNDHEAIVTVADSRDDEDKVDTTIHVKNGMKR